MAGQYALSAFTWDEKNWQARFFTSGLMGLLAFFVPAIMRLEDHRHALEPAARDVLVMG